MTPAAMHELAILFKGARATVGERTLLQNAVQSVDTLADLDGDAARTLTVLRRRVADRADQAAVNRRT